MLEARHSCWTYTPGNLPLNSENL